MAARTIEHNTTCTTTTIAFDTYKKILPTLKYLHTYEFLITLSYAKYLSVVQKNKRKHILNSIHRVNCTLICVNTIMICTRNNNY